MESKNEIMAGLVILFNYLSGIINFILLIVFIILKAVDVLKWNWFFVFSPLWIFISLFIITFEISILIAVFSKEEERWGK